MRGIGIGMRGRQKRGGNACGQKKKQDKNVIHMKIAKCTTKTTK
jgi:hypothetical protein